MIADVHDLHCRHHLVYPHGAVRRMRRPAADLKQISRCDPILASLVDEHHHLRFLEVLTPHPTNETSPDAIRNRYSMRAGAGAEALDRKSQLPIPDRPVG